LLPDPGQAASRAGGLGVTRYHKEGRRHDRPQSGRNADGTFAPGNPGKPNGTRHKTTQAALALLDGEAEALTRRAIDLALDGDTTALRLCLERIAPPRKDAPVAFAWPPMQSARDAAAAAAAVPKAVATRELTPTEGAHVMGLVEAFRRALAPSELAGRIEALEKELHR
jgi:hypothetical protein